MINSIIIVGRFTRDPEIRETTNGNHVATFNIACERDFAVNGQKETDFLPVVAWKGLAETIGKYCGKGSLVAVKGRVQTRTYEANDGGKRNITEILADSVQFLDNRKKEEEPIDDIPW